MTTVADTPTATASVGSPPALANDSGRSPPMLFAAELPHPVTGSGPGVSAGGTTAQTLLRQRARLPSGHPGRAALRERAIEAGLPLARQLAARYRGRGEPLDDLYQVAAVALIKAVDGYDPTRPVAFTSYAVPTITGAHKRHFRDATWRLRVPRRIQELAITLGPASANLTQQLGRSPTLTELAAHLGAAEHDIAVALAAWQAYQPASLDAPSAADGQTALIETIGAVDPRFNAVSDRYTLQPLLGRLPVRERRILAMRFCYDMSQAEIAAHIGVSQMHISRLLLRTLAALRTGMLAEHPPQFAPPHAGPARSPTRLNQRNDTHGNGNSS
jgi:RNA polymerase sigma-B factor